MADLYILVGIPGSGKSTVAKLLEKKIPFSRIVSDEKVREDLFGGKDKLYDDDLCVTILKHIGYNTARMDPDELNEELRKIGNNLLYNRIDATIKELLSNGVNVIYDANTITRKAQSVVLRKFMKHYTHAYAYYIRTSLETALERNKWRDPPLPEEDIRRYYRIHRFPSNKLLADVFVIENDDELPL